MAPTFPLKVPLGADPEGLRATMREYLQWMEVRQYTAATVDTRARHLEAFAAWCEERSVERPSELTKAILERHQRWLFHYRKQSGHPLGVATQYGRLAAVRVYFRWLARNNRILYNPAGELDMPRVEKKLPKAILSASEAERILCLPDVTTPLGLRDRAILETLYSTGVRRLELTQLSVFAIDRERGTLTVRLGKGKKDRIIPIGERAVAWVDKYINEARPQLVMSPDSGALFLTERSESMSPGHLSGLTKRYVRAARLPGKSGSCHLFRHSMATLMLEGGADIRFVQQMLGHSDLQATEIYTHVSIRKLKEIHSLTHPSAKLNSSNRTNEDDEDDEGEGLAERMFVSLAAEAAEEELEPGVDE